MRKNISSFSAGEISDLADDRAAIEQVQRGCNVLTNAELGRFGHLDRRSGLGHLGSLKAAHIGGNYGSATISDWRLEEFEFSAFTKFVIEMGEEYFRFWSVATDTVVNVSTPTAWSASSVDYALGDAVTYSPTSSSTFYCIKAHTSGDPGVVPTNDEFFRELEDNILEIWHPYQADEIHEVQFQPIQDTVYLTHPDHNMRVLKRYSDTNWQLEEPGFDGPWKLGDSDITMSASGTTGSITITASADYFLDPEHVPVTSGNSYDDLPGMKMRLFYDQDEATYSESIADVATAATDPADLAGSPTTTYSEGDTLEYLNGSTYELYTCINPAGYNSATDYTVDDPGDATYATFFEAGADLIASKFFLGRWDFETFGSWIALMEVQTSPDDTTWTTVASFSHTATTDDNFVTNDTVTTAQYIRVRVITRNNASYTSNHRLKIGAAVVPGEVTITAVASATSATATVGDEDLIGSGNATKWEHEAWNRDNGFPRAVGFEDNRLIYAGTKDYPLDKWYSEINNYTNFTAGTDADSPFNISAIGRDASPIQWVSNHDGAFVGTASAEGTVPGRNLDLAVSPENLPYVRWFGNEGSAYLQPQFLNSRLFALQAGQETLNEYAYTIDRGFNGGYDPSEANLLAEHILKGLVRQLAIRRQPEKGIWCVMDDGDVAVYTHRPKANMAGWWRFSTTGDIKSCAIVRGDGVEDSTYMAVSRTPTGGSATGYMEKVALGNLAKRRAIEDETNEATVLTNASTLVYLDSASTHAGVMSTVTGLTRFASTAVTYMRDGLVRTATVSAGGVLTLDEDSTDNVVVGLPYETFAEPRSIESFSEFGTSMSRRKQIKEIMASYYLSTGGQVRDTSGDWFDITYSHTTTDNPTGARAYDLKTAQENIPVCGNANRKKSVAFRTSEPYPFTLLGLYVEMKENPQ